jgi:hypothetical protein
VDALPATVEDWDKARKTARSGVLKGQQKPLPLGQEFADEGGHDDEPDDVEPGPGRSVATGIPWPKPLEGAAYHGLAGEIVNAINPLTEADPAAVLMHFLVFFGNAIGRRPYYQIGRTRHATNLYALIVGPTSDGRKGTAKDDAKALVLAADITWMKRFKPGGLVSGEGLIWHVRDDGAVFNRRTKQMEIVQGVDDKRLMIMESEYARVLEVMKRDGNSLSGTLRVAWEDDFLTTLGKNEPVEATGALVSLATHISPEELRALTKITEIENGGINRCLIVCAKSTKDLPFPGDLPDKVFDGFVDRIAQALAFARTVGRMTMTDAAAAGYAALYPGLKARPPGLFGAATRRAPAQVCRLAMLYALLDRRNQIDRNHLAAAVAVWRYCEASARHVIGDITGDPAADAILVALRHLHPEPMSRTDISEYAFNRHKPAAQIDTALALLRKLGRAKPVTIKTGGRPVQKWGLP